MTILGPVMEVARGGHGRGRHGGHGRPIHGGWGPPDGGGACGSPRSKTEPPVGAFRIKVVPLKRIGRE